MAAFLARMTMMRAATSSVQLVHPAFRSCHSRLLSTAFHGSSFRSLKDSQPRYHLPRLNLVTHLTPAKYCREFSSDKPKDVDSDEKKKTGIVAKFKQMFKDYWYVLVPVHVATSIVWFGSFYFMCKSGVDVVAILHWCGFSEEYLEKLKNSDVQYYALAYACYKVATPARYTVTVGGTTWSIFYLEKWGMLKTTTQVAEGMREKRDVAKEKFEDEWEKAWKRFAKRRGK